MKIVLNKNKKHVEVIRKAIKANYGYCPCSLVRSPATKCMCEEFREQQTPGYCHCKLYQKVEQQEGI